MVILLVLVSLALLGIGLLMITQATLGVGLVAVACVMAILARIAQASDQHAELMRQIRQPQPPTHQ